jgi:hypothetical protein
MDRSKYSCHVSHEALTAAVRRRSFAGNSPRHNDPLATAGCSVPLGYDCKDKRLVVNPAEANAVRMIFDRYLALEGFNSAMRRIAVDTVITVKVVFDRGLTS